MPQATASNSADLELADQVAEFYNDPLGFVLFAYPWGEPGSLKDFKGPDKWQKKFLQDLGAEVRARKFDGVKPVKPVRMAVTKGHGVGGSVMAAWLCNWIMSTRPESQGTVSANTFLQLQTKTWAQIQKWTRLCITSHWFNITSERLYAKDYPSSWFCSPQSCKEENSEAFAGQHAASSTSFYIFDESSGIPDKIFEVAEGGLTDGEPMIFLFGNPTRKSGKLYRVCFGDERNRWNSRTIDSRESAFTNKEQIEEWRQDNGEDSDFFRVRVLGLPPSADDIQFIDSARIYEAQRRVPQVLADEPLICGVDVARGGDDGTVLRFRRGQDARSIPPIRVSGELSRDSMMLVSKLAEVLSDQTPQKKVSAMFVDSAYGGAVVNRLRQLGYRQVHEINFGGISPDPHQSNMRCYMWQKMKDWLLWGAIDRDHRLETDLSGVGKRQENKRQQLVLESKEDMKKRGLDSPDDGDALALTFAMPISVQPKKRRPPSRFTPWS